MTSQPLEVWTDGACPGNGKGQTVGGWGWVTTDGRRGSGSEADSTNQRMELAAVLDGLQTVTERPLVVVSDSSYVVNCFRDGWWRGWERRGWVNTKGQPVANRDLWEPLLDLALGADRGRDDVSFRWVKGHAGHQLNEEADRLAVTAAKSHGQAPDPSTHVCDTGLFDRTICPDPCGAMHSYCGVCGKRADPCPLEETTAGADALRDAVAMLLLGSELDEHVLTVDLDGDGWNEPFSDRYVCLCGSWETTWHQQDPDCSGRPEPADMLIAWARHVEQARHQAA